MSCRTSYPFKDVPNNVWPNVRGASVTLSWCYA